MKKITAFLKALVLFITAVWGFILGVFGPAAMLAGKSPNASPKWLAAWLIISVIGFIVPCFLIRFGAYKTAAVLSAAGAIALLILHGYSESPKAAPLYLPLLTETLAAVLIAVITRKRKIPAKNKDAPAPSVLGGGYYEHKRNSQKKGGK